MPIASLVALSSAEQRQFWLWCARTIHSVAASSWTHSAVTAGESVWDMPHVQQSDAEFVIWTAERFSYSPPEQDFDNNALTREMMIEGCQKSNGFCMHPRSAHCITGATGHEGGCAQVSRNWGFLGCNASVVACAGASQDARTTRQSVPAGAEFRSSSASSTFAASLVGQPPLSIIRAVMIRASRESSRTTTRVGAGRVNK